MLTIKLQHPTDVIIRCTMLDYLKEIGPDKAKKKLANKYKDIFYEYTTTDDEVLYDFIWDKLLFELDLDSLNNIMNHLEDEVFEVEAAQGKAVAEKKVEMMKEQEAHYPVAKDINLLDFARKKIQDSKNKIVGLDGRELKSTRGIL